MSTLADPADPAAIAAQHRKEEESALELLKTMANCLSPHQRRNLIAYLRSSAESWERDSQNGDSDFRAAAAYWLTQARDMLSLALRILDSRVPHPHPAPPGPTLEATTDLPVVVYYCKAGKSTGLTVRALHDKQVYHLRGVSLENATAEMRDGNSTGKPKASGARCVLQITKGKVLLHE